MWNCSASFFASYMYVVSRVFEVDDFFQRRCWTIILLFNSILDFYLIYFDYHLRKKVCGCNCAFLKILKSSSIALHFFWNLSKIFCSRCKLTFSLQTITPNSPTRHDIPEFCIQGRITRTHILSLSPLLSHKYTLSNHSLSHTYITQTHQCTNSFSQTLSLPLTNTNLVHLSLFCSFDYLNCVKRCFKQLLSCRIRIILVKLT